MHKNLCSGTQYKLEFGVAEDFWGESKAATAT